MNPQDLLQALKLTLGSTNEEIRLAEQALQKAKTIAGYIPNLLLIACEKTLDENVRLAAIVNLQTEVTSYWKSKPHHDHQITDEDRNTLKENILEALIKCADTPKIYKQIEVVIHHVAGHDFPTNWQSILPEIMVKLKSSDKFYEIYGSLLALKNLIENFEFLLDKDREPLELLVPNSFPMLETFATNLLKNYDEKAAHALHCVLKTFFAAIHIQLPSYLMNEQNLENWMTFIMLVLEKELGEELEAPSDDPRVIAARQSNIFWLNKKWAAKIVDKFVYKYSDKRYERAANTGISQIYQNKYAIPFLKTSAQVILKKREKFVHVKVYYFALRYIFRALKFPELAKLLVEHLESIMFDNLIPAMYLNQKDEEDWQSDPIEFIRKEEDFTEANNNIKNAAKDLWERICESDWKAPDGESFMMKFMQYAATTLSTGVDPRTNKQMDLLHKEALMHIIGTIEECISANKEICSNMEYLLDKYVVPEFGNKNGFLKARACWLFGIYGSLEYKDNTVIAKAVEGLYNCIIDKELPVQIKAAIALSKLLNQKETVRILKDGLGIVLENYVKLINAIDNDDLVYALEELCRVFQDDIHPYALGLIQNIAEVFFKANETEGGADGGNDSFDSDDAERQFAASGCLNAIETVIRAELPNETLLKAEDYLITILEFCFSQKGCDYVDEGLKILAAILKTSSEISQRMWGFFPRLNYMVVGKPDALINHQLLASLPEDERLVQQEEDGGWAADFINEMVPCFQNYIQKGAHVIFTEKDPYLNITLIEQLFKTIDRIYEICYNGNGQDDCDMILASILYITLLENYPNKIDQIATYILEKVVTNFEKSKSEQMIRMHIQIVAMALWYDPNLTMNYLQSVNYTETIFKHWTSKLNDFKTDFELRRILFGFASMLRLDLTSLPSIVLNSLPGFLHEMIRISRTILDLREKDCESVESEVEEDNEEDYQKTIKKIEKFNKKYENDGKDTADDDDDDEEEDGNYEGLDYINTNPLYESPLEDTCEILYFRDSLQLLNQNQYQTYEQLVACLSEEEKAAVQKIFEDAVQQDLEYKKAKEEDLAKKAQKA